MLVSKRMIAVALSLGLVAGALAMPAEAAKKKKKAPKPVETVLYMHGEQNFGEVDGAMWFADGTSPESPMTLDGVAPEGSSAKSQAIGSPVWNSKCTGLPLGFPTFTGKLEGTITGDVKLLANFQGIPQAGVARIWADVGAFQACNDDYIEPNAEIEFEATSGEVEIVFEQVEIPAMASIMVEILIPQRAAPTPRLLYDAESAASRLEFGCIPPKGAKACVVTEEAEE